MPKDRFINYEKGHCLPLTPKVVPSSATSFPSLRRPAQFSKLNILDSRKPVTGCVAILALRVFVWLPEDAELIIGNRVFELLGTGWPFAFRFFEG
jgi:hypothetical protein